MTEKEYALGYIKKIIAILKKHEEEMRKKCFIKNKKVIYYE